MKYSRKLDSLGRIIIPAKLREDLGMQLGQEYEFGVRQIDGRNYLVIDCGIPDEEYLKAMKIIQKKKTFS